MSETEGKCEKILPSYRDVKHFNLCSAFPVEAFESALKYKPRPDDLFIVTYPKCGTTWVQNIVACIYSNGKPFSNALEFLSNTPFLELTGARAAETMKRPGAIKVHLPFHLTPYSPETKYIFVARNPKDCCVSFYHHSKNLPIYKFRDGAFDDFFELFMDGTVDFGDYFDTLLSWYAHKDDPNVLFITYEELKNDPEKNILRIAEFMDPKYKEAMELDPKFLKDVVHYSSFNYMKEFLNKQFQEIANMPREVIESSPDIPDGLRKMILEQDQQMFSHPDAESSYFVRKGIVGDWRNHFSEEQSYRMDAKFRVRTKGTDVAYLWQSNMV